MQGSLFNKKALLSFALICFIFLTAAFSNFEAVKSLTVRWVKFDENLGHAVPMCLLSLFFLIKATPNLLIRSGIPLLAFALFPVMVTLVVFMQNQGILLIQQLLVCLFLAVSFVVVFEARSLKGVLFAISLLIFVIPVWDHFVPFLADLTTVVVQYALQLSGIVAFFEGRNIELPFGIITVADSCSGVRYATIGLALSYLSSFTLPINLTTRIKIILAGLALSIFANWLRVYILVLIGYYSEMQSELVADHEFFGFVLFFIVISPIALYKAKRVNEPDKWGDALFSLFESLFNKQTASVPLAVRLLLLVVISMSTALLLKYL